MSHVGPDLNARSPWSTLHDIAEVEVHPCAGQLSAQVNVPGSKSFTNRALIIAGLAEGSSSLSGILKSDDSYWCIDTLQRLGLSVRVESDVVEVDGGNGAWQQKEGQLYIGAAGTIARFLPGALAAATDGEWTITASKRMSERPVQPLIDALSSLGANFTYLDKHGFLPVQVNAKGLRGGNVSISGSVSSQFMSGLLIASPYADAPVTVQLQDQIVQHAYVHITLDVMRAFGAEVDAAADLSSIRIEPKHYVGRPMQLEADASTACYFFALAALNKGRIRVTNITTKTRQPDILFIDVLERMGCRVDRGVDYVEVENSGGLRGGFTVSMKEMSDQALTLAAVAVFADAPITITDVAHIRHHESDRIRVICEELEKLGIRTEEREDGLTVWPGQPSGALLSTHDDHRVAMSLALIGTVVPGIRLSDPGCVSKTCPVFFEELDRLGIRCSYMTK